jgi:ubiquinone/menaquinone biosynthesis C-methylase UbiE
MAVRSCTTAAATRSSAADVPSSLKTKRQRGVEYLETPHVDPALVRRSLSDVARSNRLFGGVRAVLAELDRALPEHAAAPISLLDVGTGLGDIPLAARRAAAHRGITLRTLVLDSAETLVRASRDLAHDAIRGDALALPLANRSVDVVTCSQVLHHFRDEDAVCVVRELDRVARRCVIVSDIRRSWVAAAGIWMASFPLGFHPVSRHDGVVSVMRGFTRGELMQIVRVATSRSPEVRRHLGFRVTAVWTPADTSASVGPRA